MTPRILRTFVAFPIAEEAREALGREARRLADEVRITTSVKRMGSSSVSFAHFVLKIEPGGVESVAVTAEATIAFTDPAMSGSRPIPDEFRRLYG